jgi:hypothetical protein
MKLVFRNAVWNMTMNVGASRPVHLCFLLCLIFSLGFPRTIVSLHADQTSHLAASRFPIQMRQSGGVHEYYVDCGGGEGDADGASPASAWRTINAVNSHTFLPGDIIRFKRGTECHGSLWPKGSGSDVAIIRMSAYGTGARPKVIAGKMDDEVFKLFNQEYWDVDSIDFSGGTLFGVFVSGDKGILHHIHLRNLLVHDVYGENLKSKDCGLVLIQPGKAQQHFDDVLVEEVTAYRTNQWAGILVGGGNFGFLPEPEWSTHVTVRNSVVHDVYGDGIVLFRVRDGRIDTTAAWHTGMQPTQTTGTPNAIWTWMCTDCVVIHSEAFLTDSPGVDGGAFDIDYGNTRNSVIDNYGHDTQGYCIAVFGAGFVTHDSVVEGNLCINNGKSPRMASYQGAIFVWTWNNGSIENLRIEKNTVFWAPPGSAPALINHAAIQGAQVIFRGNNIYSSSPWIVDSDKQISFQNNRYTTCPLSAAIWVFDHHTYDSFDQFHAGTGQDQGSAWNSDSATRTCPGLERLRPKTNPSGSKANSANSASVAKSLGGWAVRSEIPVSIDANGFLDVVSAGQLIVFKNLYTQFQSSSLRMILTLHLEKGSAVQSVQDVIRDLDMGDVKLAVTSDLDSLTRTKTRLFDPSGSTAMEWQDFVGPAEIGLAVRSKLGEPIYSQLEPGAVARPQ